MHLLEYYYYCHQLTFVQYGSRTLDGRQICSHLTALSLIHSSLFFISNQAKQGKCIVVTDQDIAHRPINKMVLLVQAAPREFAGNQNIYSHSTSLIIRQLFPLLVKEFDSFVLAEINGWHA